MRIDRSVQVTAYDPTLFAASANHSALLSAEQWRALAATTGADADDPWGRIADGTEEVELCRVAAEHLAREAQPPLTAPLDPPADVESAHTRNASTQQEFGRFFADLSHKAPDVAARVVTVSQDVASSTNLGGSMNHLRIWHLGERIDWFAHNTDTLVRWRQSADRQTRDRESKLVGSLGERDRQTRTRCRA